MTIQALYDRFDAQPMQHDLQVYLESVYAARCKTMRDEDAECAAAIEGRIRFNRVEKRRFAN